VSQLRRELARVKAEDQMVIESLHNRVHELEMELNDLRQIAESTTTVSQHTVPLYLHFECVTKFQRDDCKSSKNDCVCV